MSKKGKNEILLDGRNFINHNCLQSSICSSLCFEFFALCQSDFKIGLSFLKHLI